MSLLNETVRKRQAEDLLEWSRSLETHGLEFGSWRSQKQLLRRSRRTQELHGRGRFRGNSSR